MNNTKYFIIGIIIIFLSPIMGLTSVDIFYSNSLGSIYGNVINNFSIAYMLIGCLIFVLGLKRK